MMLVDPGRALVAARLPGHKKGAGALRSRPFDFQEKRYFTLR